MILHGLKKAGEHVVDQLELIIIRLVSINPQYPVDLVQDEAPAKHLHADWLRESSRSLLVLLDLLVLIHSVNKSLVHLLHICIGIQEL